LYTKLCIISSSTSGYKHTTHSTELPISALILQYYLVYLNVLNSQITIITDYFLADTHCKFTYYLITISS